jgi:hypothetical protein
VVISSCGSSWSGVVVGGSEADGELPRSVPALEVERGPFGGEPAGSAGEGAAGTQNPVAGHRDRDGVAGHGGADLARAVLDQAEPGGEVAVGGGLAKADVGEAFEEAAPGAVDATQVDRDGELPQPADEVFLELVAREVQPRPGGRSGGVCGPRSGRSLGGAATGPGPARAARDRLPATAGRRRRSTDRRGSDARGPTHRAKPWHRDHQRWWMLILGKDPPGSYRP